MPKEPNLELKVGGLVILAMVSLLVFILSVSDFSFYEDGNLLRVIFGFANGVKKSAPVRMAGVETGIVKDIRLFFDKQENKTKAEVLILVKKDVLIPQDSRFMINQLGLLGEKYIEIMPGFDTEHFLKDKDVVLGKDPAIQEQITQKIIDVTSKLERGIEGLNQVINEPSNQESLKLTLTRLSSLTDRLDHLLEHVESGQGTVGKLFFDERLYDDLQSMMSDLKANPWKLLYRPRENPKR